MSQGPRTTNSLSSLTSPSDGKYDYLTLDPKTGALKAFLNKGPSTTSKHGWDWLPLGQIADGSGEGFPGRNVRIADIDGDGVCAFLFSLLYLNMSTKLLTER